MFRGLAVGARGVFYTTMLADYIAKAVEKAGYEKMENGHFFATIPGFKGLWAEGKTVEAARRELIETLGDWVLISFRRGYPVPVLPGVTDLNKIGAYAKAS